MMLPRAMGILACLMAICVTGCEMPWLYGDSTAPIILGIEDDEALLQVQEFKQGDFTRTSAWRLDLKTGDMQELLEPPISARWAVAGDFFVMEDVTAAYETEGFVVGRFSTGDQATISDRTDAPAGTHFVDGYGIDGERAVVGVENGVLVYDLATFSEVRRIEVPEKVQEIRAFRHGRIFAAGWEDSGNFEWNGWEELYLVDSATGEVTLLPDAPRDGELYSVYRNVHLTDEWLVMDQSVVVGDSTDTGSWAWLKSDPVIRDEILAYNIASGDWKVLYQSESYDPDTLGSFETGLIGGDETRVLARSMSLLPGALRLEAIDLDTGDSSLLTETTGRYLKIALEYGSPYLVNERLYWIDLTTNELVIRDLGTGQEQRIPTIEPPL